MEQLLTCLFNLRLSRLGGGYELCGGLRYASGRLLQAVQICTVFVCFDLDVKQQQTDEITNHNQSWVAGPVREVEPH